jgi:hypothetical protein
MTDAKALAAAAKARGNAAFTKGDFATAATEFTTAIENDPTDHVFFRSCASRLLRAPRLSPDACGCLSVLQ